jgi:hypothetical protein
MPGITPKSIKEEEEEEEDNVQAWQAFLHTKIWNPSLPLDLLHELKLQVSNKKKKDSSMQKQRRNGTNKQHKP